MTDIAIITLSPRRWREARKLRLEALLEEPQAFASSYAEEAAFDDSLWLNRLATAEARDGNLTYYAENCGKLVGMAGATWSQREKRRHVADIYSVYVSPAERGKGIASALLRALLGELASMPQIVKVSLTVNSNSQAAIRLYQRMNFEIVGTARRDLLVEDCFYDLHYMERHFTTETE